MIKARARYGQTLADMAIQTKGAIESIVDLALVNNLGLTDVFDSGREIYIPDKTYNDTMEHYVKSHGISPATDRDDSGVLLRVFTEQYTQEFA